MEGKRNSVKISHMPHIIKQNKDLYADVPNIGKTISISQGISDSVLIYNQWEKMLAHDYKT